MELIQFQAPSTGADICTLSARCTAALSATGWLNFTTMGMPTPTVPLVGSMSSVRVATG